MQDVKVCLQEIQQSPPPEPTPSPPPQPPPVAKPLNSISSSFNTPEYRRNDTRAPSNNAAHINHVPSYVSTQVPQYPQHSTSPAPIQHPHQYTQQSANNFTPSVDHYATPQNRYTPAQRPPHSESAYPRPDEVFRLPENANLAIPEDIRSRFQQDEQGHVLFFTAPPLDTLQPVKPGSAVGHTAEYLAAKLRAQIRGNEKRKVAVLLEEGVEGGQDVVAKKLEHEEDKLRLTKKIKTTRDQALKLWIKQMESGTNAIYQDLYGIHWKEGKKNESELLMAKQAEASEERRRIEDMKWRREELRKVSLEPATVFKDDWDPRY